ncbi:uncharacterized protein KIAA0754-like [Quercus lobata]|uniref:uncharacterized protein KIAA0754-like n=1 Tax=Quercus lobata TaxID=97700 RepID=UPI0012457EC5|nr:uncharacterized protein KIAA0754-like [Quercus lobata]
MVASVNPRLLLPSKSVLAYARKQSWSAIFELDAEKKGWFWHTGDYPPGWEKRVKVINISVLSKKAPAKPKSAGKTKPATPLPPAGAPLTSRTRGSKRKTTLHLVSAAERRSKHKEDSSVTRPILFDEPESEEEPESLSIYRPTAEEISASMGVPMEGFFDGAEAVLATPAPSTATHKTPAKTPTPFVESVPREGTHVEGVGETTPLPAERPTLSEGAIPPAAVQNKTTSPVLPLVISTSDPFAAISQAAKDGASLVVTPSSIPGFATRGPDSDLSSKGSNDILEDPDDAPVLKKRISDSVEEGSASPEPDFMETSEGPEIAAGVGMTAPAAPVAPIPAAPSVPVSAVPTTPAFDVSTVLVSATPVAPIPGLLPTIPS